MAVHKSVALPEVEVVDLVPSDRNPLISKCNIKVCYVGDEPNRNRSIITKETAREMAKTLPGSPIVGLYNEEKEDFEEHSRSYEIVNNELVIKDITKGYGFISLNPKVWFQKFIDDDENEHEYLMTEGWLWTGQYPECQRILERGNNQSMELDEKTLDGTWTKDNNKRPQFFIINEAIISKLCILGEDQEPCFEGSNITAPTIQFSFEENFKNQLFSMMEELKEVLEKGGETVNLPETETTTEQIAEEETQIIEETPVEMPAEEYKKSENEDKADKEDNEKSENKSEEDVCPKCGKPLSECTCDEKEKKYSLEEIPEYVELKNNYSALESEYNTLKSEKENLESQIEALKEFKLQAERKDKEAMIANFYMLSDEDKADVVTNIDTYSLDDIEAKLSIMCYRNKVNFNAEEQEDKPAVTFNLNESDDVSTPAWVKRALAVATETLQ